VNAITGSRAGAADDGAIFQTHRRAQMTVKQQWLTTLMAVLMLATLLLMPSASPKKAPAQVETRSEQSHDIAFY
jgi:hypothetical protein